MPLTASPARVERLAALTFDLDTLSRDLYRPALSPGDVRRLEDVSFQLVVPRIAAWLQQLGVHATFFTIGEYARRYPAVVRQLAMAGHEIASHTQSHPRNFSELSPVAVRHEITAAHAAITAAAGVEPRGFRAPGFTTSRALIEVLTDLDYTYDSSMVPSWSYTTLKHVYRLARLASTGYLYPESYRCMRAPKIPYRIAAARRFEPSGGAPLLEIPVTTALPLQWPFIYGLHARAHGRMRSWIERSALWRPFVLMVFHDLEFATREDLRQLPVGVLTGPHVGRPIAARLSRIEDWIRHTRATHRFATLREVAAAYAPAPVSIAL